MNAATRTPDGEDARALLQQAGIQAFKRQAGYVPRVDMNPIVADPVPDIERRGWCKELFDSVHPLAVEILVLPYLNWLKSKKSGISYRQARQFVTAIVKQNRKFIRERVSAESE